MLQWLNANWASLIVGIVLLAAIAGIVVKLVRDKRNGKSGCGCNCAGCPGAALCHRK